MARVVLSGRGTAGALDRVAQIADRKYCRPHARPFRLGFPRKVPVFPICPPAALQALRRPRPSALAAVNLAAPVRHGCRSAGLACPLGCFLKQADVISWHLDFSGAVTGSADGLTSPPGIHSSRLKSLGM